MPGVHIGDGAIVAAGSVVESNVAPYTVVGGNPAEPLFAGFLRDVVKALREIAWWSWHIDKVTRNLWATVSADIEALRLCQ